jgi:cyclopropane fatty-acyl-phospholipid synthase-like methyltransferase
MSEARQEAQTDSLAEAQGRVAAAFFGKARRAWVDAMPLDPDLWVLEIGCGGGATGARVQIRRNRDFAAAVQMFTVTNRGRRVRLIEGHTP